MSTPVRKLNGKKGRAAAANCPHVEVCNAPPYHADVMASLDELSRSVGLLLEQTQQHSDRIIAVADRLHDVSQRQVVADERETKWLETVGGFERAVAALRREAKDA